MKEFETKIIELIEPLVSALGFELWGCEHHSAGRHTVLRVYIDSSTGVTVDDCGFVSNRISGVLDVEDIIHGTYALEVSSPGMDRLLFKEEHYNKYIGSKVQLELKSALKCTSRNKKFCSKTRRVAFEKQSVHGVHEHRKKQHHAVLDKMAISSGALNNNRRNYTGVITAVNAGTVTIEYDKHTVNIPIAEVKKARIVPQY